MTSPSNNSSPPACSSRRCTRSSTSSPLQHRWRHGWSTPCGAWTTPSPRSGQSCIRFVGRGTTSGSSVASNERSRSEEHTSELQSRSHLVCRLLLEKKKSVLELSTRLHTPPQHEVSAVACG